MFLSTGGTNISVPINSAVGIGETKVLQANLASNLSSATLVSGNANTVLDTAGNSNWKFYVAGGNSIASITGASNSTEWTGGYLLTYVGASASPPPTDYSLYYTFNTNKVSGTTITDSVTNATGTLVGATITTTSPSPAPGTGYLSIVNTFSPSPVTTNHASLTSITFPTGGMTLSCWIKPRTANAAHIISLNTGASNNIILVNGLNNLTGIVVKGGAIGTYSIASPTSNLNIIGIWNHIVWTLSPSNIYQFYVNGVLTNTHSGATHYYPNNVTTTASYIGRSIYGDAYYDGDFDDFRIYNRILTSDEAYSVFMAGAQSKFNDVTTGVTWIPTPAVPVNSSETSYTVKSNEIALTPGTNSTYAVWTAPKSTNIRVDVSFADYHSRSAGVGFQMFKINNDNTFGSVIYPRTVTSVALTNANPNNYLSVPSKTISVATGDKIYLRVDANGNTTAASSVLSTNIYVDPNEDLKQPNLLQAHLGNNMAATTFVAGNANVVNDTRGTGSWKFYVAGGNSIASITGASASSEWTGGSLLSAQYAFDGTLMNGATYSFDSGSRVPGKQYLKLDNNPIKSQFAKFNQFEITSGGMSFSFWVKIVGGVVNSINATPFFVSMRTPGNLDIGLFPEWTCQVTGGYKLSVAGLAATIKDGSWHHIVVTISGAGVYKFYLDNLLRSTQNAVYPALGTRTNNNLGSTDGAFTESYVLNGGIDNFRIFRSELTALEVTNEYNNNNYPTTTSLMLMTDAGVAPSWMPTPATPVDASETSYTIKNNEVALTPGTNSTYAVWTATKSTNIKVDVSFADYHSRSAGVGFQMFKIKSDNTFDSVLFPRTVTSTALTNAAPNNYLPVPSVSTSVSAGDKIYLRVDANGNTTAASSVLATTIFTDAISVAPNPVENRLLQAHLGNNLNSTSFVSGNANTVLDTLGTSNWQFYAASSTSVAAISSASASSEWTGGSLLSYDLGNPIISSYSFDTTTQSGNTIQNTTTNAYDLTLINGATIGTVNPSPYYSLNSGYLTFNMNMQTAGQYARSTTPVSFSRPFSISLWVRYTGTFPTITGSVRPTLIEIGDAAGNAILMTAANFSPTIGIIIFFTGGVFAGQLYYEPTSKNAAMWNHYVLTFNGVNNTAASYQNGVLYDSQTITWNAPASFTYLNFGKTDIPSESNPTTGSWTPCIDKFQIFNVSLSASQVSSLYNNTFVAVDNPTLKNTVAGVIWKPFPATVVDDTETSYTVKSNEVALTPGTNSTYAVWTSPKTTNIKVDVSFADYHSRNVGVGFQMFKINADNTFGSVIYPRTVTSAALTNAAPNNYLSVPSRTISVATGDKLYYRVDANGNTTAASSVLATTIYVDPNQDLKQYNVLQANLGNNMAATSFVSGNANVVADTRGTGNWKFYVAGGNSIASITGASNSTEWTSGSLLSYISPLSIYYPLKVPDINPLNGLQVGDYSSGTYVYNGTLYGGASITVDALSRVAGQGYLKLVAASSQYLQLPSIQIGTSGMSFAVWFYSNSSGNFSRIIEFTTGGNDNILFGIANSTLAFSVHKGTNYDIFPGLITPTNNVWYHVVWTIASDGRWIIYINGISSYDQVRTYPTTPLRTVNYIGKSTYGADAYYNGGIDDFRYYNRVVTQTEVTAIYNGNADSTASLKIPAIIKDATTGATWIPTPGTLVDASETNYTVKSNEIALTPGTNSTYAVWTATKSTNIKVDVSFADYHSRSAGVGFQMFKIKSDNTFDSVLFPRTVTSTALTNAAPTNYLSVPSVTTTVIPGDKIYLRVDANGNTTSASSVLATNIYTDAVSIATNPAETRVLQANLAANLNATTLVSGNANVVLDTVGNGDWKFYVAGGNSIAAISSASNSTEWTGGSLLSYSDADYSVFYPFNTNTVSGSTVLNAATNAYDLTLYDGASIINTTPFPATQPPATGSGYLNMNVGAGHYAKATQTYSFNPLGSTFSFWVRWTNIDAAPVFSYGTGSNFVAVTVSNSGAITCSIRNGASQGEHRIAFQNGGFPFNYAHIAFATGTGAVYTNGVLGAYGNYTLPTYGASIQPTWFYFGNIDPSIGNTSGITRDFSTKTGILGIDNFVVYNKTLTASEVMSLYAKSDLHYPLKIPDINPGNTLQVGDVSTGPYVYNGALVNGATIVADAGSRIAGQGYLKLVKASGNYFNFNPTSVTTAGFTIAIWFRATSNNVTNSRIFDMWTNGANISIGIKSSPDGIELQYTTNLNLYTGTVRDNVWRHFILTIAYAGASGASSIFKCYIDGTLQTTYTSAYPALGTRNSNNLGTYVNSGGAGAAESFDGGLDDFRIYQRVITDSEISYLYAGSPPPSIKDSTTGAAWISKPAIAVDPAESSYTVKSNEIAMKPGTNSTYAVWTAPKSTNIRVDVSFADYHSRTAGVGFQMFKINNDNTFGSTIFPRTVTSTALTNAAPNNYLNVPSVSLSVSTGDKIYYRVDANGNTTSASSVISTNIYSYSGKWN